MTTVLVASSFPERLNRNLWIVSDLAKGFRSVEAVALVRTCPFDQVAETVLRTRPELLVLVGSALSGRCDYADVARVCRRANTFFAFWTLEDPFEFDVNYKFTDHCDLTFSNDLCACDYYEHPVRYLPTAASSAIRRDVGDLAERPIELFFCGLGFPNRRSFILDAKPTLERWRSLVIGEGWPDLPGVVLSERISHDNLLSYYGSSRCVLNLGRDHSLANRRRALPQVTPGPRTFEAAMVGCVQLYHRPTPALAELFELDTEIVGFETAAEFAAKLEDLLGDPGRAATVARAAQQRALEEHTYEARALSLLGAVNAM